MKYVKLLFIIFMTISCKSSSTGKSTVATDIHVSPLTRLLISNLEQYKPLDAIPCSFKPDSLMLNQFGLDVDSDGNCIVDGIVTLKEGRTLSDINIEEMSVSHLFKNKYHCRLPVCKFYLLLKNPNISYFEISKPIFKL